MADEPEPATAKLRRRRPRRFLASALMVIGLLLVADAICAVVAQEPVSALYTRWEQKRLDGQLEQSLGQTLPPVEARAAGKLDDGRRATFLARALDARSRPGQALGRLRVPDAGISDVVVAGTSTSALRRGPGHYPQTPLPGAPGTVAVAGHRTTYGAPFRNLDKLDRGDRIEVEMPYGTFVYAVERTRIVKPTALWVTQRVAYDRLVLTACHPLYSAEQRIVVFAREIDQVLTPRSSA